MWKLLHFDISRFCTDTTGVRFSVHFPVFLLRHDRTLVLPGNWGSVGTVCFPLQDSVDYSPGEKRLSTLNSDAVFTGKKRIVDGF